MTHKDYTKALKTENLLVMYSWQKQTCLKKEQ